MTTKHTATPWRAEPDSEPSDFYGAIYEGTTSLTPLALVEQGPNAKANADFIVWAVNNHDALLEALERLLSLVGDGCDYVEGDWPDVCPGDPPLIDGPCHFCQAQAAIAKAEGR